jgi:hypothetical protein
MIKPLALCALLGTQVSLTRPLFRRRGSVLPLVILMLGHGFSSPLDRVTRLLLQIKKPLPASAGRSYQPHRQVFRELHRGSLEGDQYDLIIQHSILNPKQLFSKEQN